MSKPSEKHCVPCEVGIPPMKGDALVAIHEEYAPTWQVIDEHHIEKQWKFPNFLEALAFVNQIGAIAEEEGHHPDITFSWGYVTVKIFTHKINGLSESDFILAAKLDEIQS